MSGESTVLWAVQDGVGRITMNRPEGANTLNRRSARDLAAAIDGVAAARGLKVVVLTARGPMYCGGGDIAEFVQHADGLPALVDDILSPLLASFERLALLPVPIVTVVNGPFGGAGIAMALVGDFVIAADTIKVRGGYVALGLSPDLGASWLLVRRVGVARARQIFMLNRPLDAERCLQWGLVDELWPADQLQAQAEKVVAQFATGPTPSYARVKDLCARAEHDSLGEHLALERRYLVERAGSADAREGVRAFIEKRPARFGGAGQG